MPPEGKFTGGSAYRELFRDGAMLYPRMLCLIERQASAWLGSDPSAPHVRSRRYAQEKEPWKSVRGIEGNVPSDFIRPIYLGESILPYRVFRPFEAVIPVTDKGEVLGALAAANRGYSGLHDWMQAAETLWEKDRSSDRLSLIQRWNYHNELGAQFPIPPLRVVYAKAGTLPAACLLRAPAGVIDHMLYWFAPSSEREGRYLLAILNSETVRARIASLQSRGQWGARHFDKVMFNLPIPRFDAASALHAQLAAQR